MAGWGAGAWGSGAWGSGAGAGNNLGFELPDPAVVGVPLDWTLVAPDTVWMRAGFDGNTLAFESFAWSGAFLDDNAGLITPADFAGPDGAETFDWHPLLETVPLVLANFTGSAFEGFESGWSNNENWKTDFVGVGTDLTAGLFDGEPEEDFEDGWSDNENWKTDFIGIGTDLTAALFGKAPAGTDPFEDFEDVYTDLEFFGFPATDELELVSNHNLIASNRVFFRNENGALPAPLQENVRYIIFSVPNPTKIKVSTQPGALVPVDITSFGLGTSFMRADPTFYWRVAP